MSDSDFKTKSCSACNGFTEKIGRDDALSYLKGLPDWALSEDGTSIYRKFNFKNFKQTMFFINAVAFLCEREGHHPDAKFSFNYCDLAFMTHELGGLSENDFICAYKVDDLIK